MRTKPQKQVLLDEGGQPFHTNQNPPRKVRRTFILKCNLCDRSFPGVTRFDRFCGTCRNSTIYRAGEIYGR